MVDNSLSWVVSSTQSKRTCRDYIKNDAWKYEELVTPRVIICDSLDLAMVLIRAFHVTSQSHEKGCTWCACKMHSNPDSWWTYLTSMFNIEFQTSPYKPLCTCRWRWQKCCRLISRDANALHPDMILWLHCNRLSACDSVVSCHAGRKKVAGIEFYSLSGSSGTNVEVHIESYTPSRV